MREGGTFTTLGRVLKVLAGDVKALVESESYKRRLTRCLLEPYDRKLLADFLALDNICRDLRILIGEEATLLLWGRRKQAFDEAWQDVEATLFPDDNKLWKTSPTHSDRRRLRDVLLNVLYKRTPDAIYEHIEIGMK